MALLSDVQLEEFGRVIEEGTDIESSAWLARHCPQHREIVNAEIDRLLAHVALIHV